MRKIVLAVSAFWLLCAQSVVARTSATVKYSQPQVFSAALRYLRVDLGYEVTEQDATAAYLLFNHPVEDKGSAVVRGAIEVVQTERGVRLFVSVPRLPGYREEVFQRGLITKLQSEYGRLTPASEKKPVEAPAETPPK